MVMKELMDMFIELAMEAGSLEQFKEMAEKKWGFSFNKDMLFYLEDAFEKSRVLLPCAENFMDYRRVGRFVWTHRHFGEELGGDEVRALMSEPMYRVCRNCGEVFVFHYCNLGLFCSKACAMTYNNKTKKETDIERLLREWLDEQNIPYEAQYRIDLPDDRWTTVDFLVFPNICLYADDEYWHSLGDKPETDAFQDEELPKLGYVVIRMFGSKIRNGERPLVLLKLSKKN